MNKKCKICHLCKEVKHKTLFDNDKYNICFKCKTLEKIDSYFVIC